MEHITYITRPTQADTACFPTRPVTAGGAHWAQQGLFLQHVDGVIEGFLVRGAAALGLQGSEGGEGGCFSITLWLFNIAMENDPFIDGLPIENADFPWLC